MPVVFITGIDTGVGKTHFTGLLAKFLMNQGKSVITQKLVQTGCSGISEDILTHRKMMGIELTEFDKDLTTCPYVFPFPASPHYSSERENITIQTQLIQEKTKVLLKNFQWVLLEGAGGLKVPLNDHITILDYIEENNYPVILVAHSNLGSINHTLLSVEVIKVRKIRLLGVAYNQYFSQNNEISENTFQFLTKNLAPIPVVKLSHDFQNFHQFLKIFF